MTDSGNAVSCGAPEEAQRGHNTAGPPMLGTWQNCGLVALSEQTPLRTRCFTCGCIACNEEA